MDLSLRDSESGSIPSASPTHAASCPAVIPSYLPPSSSATPPPDRPAASSPFIPSYLREAPQPSRAPPTANDSTTTASANAVGPAHYPELFSMGAPTKISLVQDLLLRLDGASWSIEAFRRGSSYLVWQLREMALDASCRWGSFAH